MSKFIVVIGLILFLSSCAVNQITMNQIQTIEKGISIEECIKMLGSKKPKYEFIIQFNDLDYFIQIYDMVVRQEEHHYYGKNTFGKNGGNISLQFGGFTPPSPPTIDMPKHHSYTQTYTEPYSFVFLDDKLLYWGLFEELNKSEDVAITELAPEISLQYKKLELERRNSSNW